MPSIVKDEKRIFFVTFFQKRQHSVFESSVRFQTGNLILLHIVPILVFEEESQVFNFRVNIQIVVLPPRQQDIHPRITISAVLRPCRFNGCRKVLREAFHIWDMSA
jgi:hypothetical protein